MTNIDPKAAVAEAQAEADRLKTFLAQLKNNLKAEREGGPPSPAELEAATDRIEAEIAGYQREINAAKALAKKRKREIDEWKLWYQGIGSVDKMAEKIRLDNELAWRANEINSAQEKIGALEAQKWESQGKMETVLQQIAALEAGVYDKPISEDPRLVDVQEAQRAAQEILKAAKAAAKKGRSSKQRGAK